MKRTTWSVGIVIAILLCGGIFLLQYDANNELTSTSESELSREAPEGYKEYRSEKFGISFFYEEDFEALEFEDKGAYTLVFQNPAEGRGFQMFVIPYGAKVIGDERFLNDVPSGVRENVTTERIDGREAVAFHSNDMTLGDTFEFWFIEHGYLFEITTLKELEPRLRQRLASWKFI